MINKIKNYNNLKKLGILFYITVFMFTFNSSAFAQSSLTPIPTQAISASDTPEESILEGLGEEALENIGIGEVAIEALSEEVKYFEPPIVVKNLLKTTYQVKEKVDVIVENVEEADVESFDLLIENINSRGVDAEIETKYVNDELVFSINPEAGLSPGKYRVKVVDIEENRIISEQNFNWGVLAINVDKSIYLPGETADIQMAVLDEGGNMVCDAKVTLTMRAPWGQITKLTTEDGDIIVNHECREKALVDRPDFETTYETTDVGRYLMTLEAETRNGTFTVKDRFEVRRYIPFEVERITATRIYPPEKYPVRIKITANEDFKGKIVESVPLDFQIRETEDDSVSFQELSSLPDSFDPLKEHQIPKLPLPFNDEFPQTLGFGQQIEGHGMELTYKKSGIDGHDGVDFALPKGTPVLAVDDGRIILAEENWVYGHTVVIEHKWGRTYYGHLSEISAKEGTSVEQGEVLGLSGNTGLSTGPHLHFGLKPSLNEPDNLYYGKIDPSPFFGLASIDEELSRSDQPLMAKAVVWNVDVKKGSTFTIGYDYKSPKKSPYFYKIGPLQFISSEFVESSLPAAFDVQVEENAFVLGEATVSAGFEDVEENATPSAEIVKIENTATESAGIISEGSSIPQEEVNEEPIVGSVVFKEIREWQIAVDAAGDSDIQAATGTFVANTSGSDNVVTGVGFQPKALILRSMANTTDDTAQVDSAFSIGFTDGTTDVSFAVESEDSAGDVQRCYIAAAVQIRTANSTCGTDYGDGGALGTLQSFDSDGFTIDWAGHTPDAAYIISYVAFGGADLQAYVGTDTVDSSPASVPGFDPDIVFLASHDTTLANAAPADGIYAFGAFDANGQWWVGSTWGTEGNNKVGSLDNGGTAGCLGQFWTTTTTWEMTSCTLGTNQFSWTGSNADAFGYLALNVGENSTNVGTITKSTSAAPVDQSISGWGFTNSAAVVGFGSAIKTTQAANLANVLISVGEWDGSNQQAMLLTEQGNNFADADTRTVRESNGDPKLMMMGTINASILAEAEGKTLDNDGVDITWTTNNSSAYYIGYWAIEGAAGSGTPTNAQLLRHGNWFSGGVEKTFYY